MDPIRETKLRTGSVGILLRLGIPAWCAMARRRGQLEGVQKRAATFLMTKSHDSTKEEHRFGTMAIDLSTAVRALRNLAPATTLHRVYYSGETI